jgi:hypothetical protein
MGQRYPAPLHREKILSYRPSKGGFSEPPGLLGTPVAFTDLFAQVLEHDAPVHIKRMRASNVAMVMELLLVGVTKSLSRYGRCLALDLRHD